MRIRFALCLWCVAIFPGLLFGAGPATAAVRGDVAPSGMPDGELNSADLGVVQQFLLGNRAPDAGELVTCDVAPQGAPDGVLNVADFQLLERAALGYVVLDSVTGILAPRLWGTGGLVTRSPYFLSGLARPGATIRVYRDGSVIAEVPADANGLFSTRLDLVAGVEHSIHVTQVLGGFESLSSGALTVELQAASPAGPDLALITIDTGSDGYPDTVSAPAGTVPPGATVVIRYADGSRYSAGADQEGGFRARRLATRSAVAAISYIGTDGVESERSVMLVPGTMAGTFAVEPGGAATYSIPITLPPGTAGMTPALSLDYHSHGGNGPLGPGWTLNGLSSITRCPKTRAQDGTPGGINLDASDRFCLDGRRLVAVSGGYGEDLTEYRTEIESFARVVSYGGTPASPDHFIAWSREGRRFRYGYNPDSGFDPGGAVKMLWAVDRVEDRQGNYYAVSYHEDRMTGEHYPLRVDYTGNDAAGLSTYNSVRFVYEQRTDISGGYVGGRPVAGTVRLVHISSYDGPDVVRDYRLTYGIGALSGNSRLGSVTECETDAAAAACLPPTRFAWSGAAAGFGAGVTSGTTSNGYADARVMDVNGDGRDDLVVPHDGNWWVNYGSDSGMLPEADTGISTAGAYPDKALQIDYDSDGMADLLVPGSDGYWDLLRADAGSGGLVAVANLFPNSGYDNYRSPQVLDIDGDGRQDLMTVHGSGTWHVRLNGPSGLGTELDTGVFPAGTKPRIIDYDNDGRMDLLTAVASGLVNGIDTCEWWLVHFDGRDVVRTLAIAATPDQSGSYLGCKSSTGTGYSFLGDRNGDGLQDLAFFRANTNWLLVHHTGDGFSGPLLDSGLNDGNQWYAHALDFNSDGRMDFLIPSSADGNWHIYRSTSAGVVDVATGLAHSGYADTRVMDVNGDGLPDIVSPYAGSWYVHLNQASRSDQLTSITDGLGRTTEIVYAALTDDAVYSEGAGAVFPLQDFRAPVHVVSQSRVDNGIGGSNITTYRYKGAKVHLQGRGLLGFREVSATDQQTGAATVTTYHQEFPYAGLPERSATYVNGGLITQRENSYSVVENFHGVTGVYFPYAGRTVDTVYEMPDVAGNPGALVRTVRTDTAYDASGNPLVIDVATTGPDGVAFGKVTTHTYLPPDIASWVLDRVVRTTVVHTVSNIGAPHNEISSVSAFSYYPAGHASRFLLMNEIIEPDAGDGSPLYKLATHEYDAFGNQTRVVTTARAGFDAGSPLESRVADTAYDARGRFPVRSVNALGHAETYTHDRRSGARTRITGPNGLATTWVYDGFGRKRLEVRADGGETAWDYDFCAVAECPVGGTVETVTVSGSHPLVTYHDALQRVIRTTKLSLDGRVIVQDTAYDERGNVASRTRPYFQGATTQVSTYSYDAMDRPIREDSPDGGIVEYAYSGFVRTVHRHHVNGDYDQSETRINDALDRLLYVIDAGGARSYEYDAIGNPVSTASPGIPATLAGFDSRGRRISLDDPDMGRRDYRYNGFDELVWERDANGRVVSMVYDRLGRMVSRSEPEGISDWIYDSAVMGVGKLSQVSASAGGHSRIYTYDDLGRLASETGRVDGESLTMAYSYDGFSRRETISYPTGFMVRNVYNARGFLVEVRNAMNDDLFWRQDDDDAEGHVTLETLGNGLQTARVFSGSGGTLETISTGGGMNAAVQNLSYVFDALGNLRSRTDARQGYTESFGYDGLNRLTTATIAGVGGRSYVYDDSGNIISKSDTGDSFGYGANGAGPHAVTAVSSGGSLLASYSYDANGNMTGGDGRSIAWTSFNKPLTIEKGTARLDFTYGADHDRVKQVAGDHTIYYVSPRIDAGTHYEKGIDGGLVTHMHYIYADTRSIAIYTQGGSAADRIRYLHTDHLGSTDAITDERGQVVERLSFDAFGGRRQADWNDASGVLAGFETHHGFTGHEQLDEVGLIHMNGRLYDPKLGRFLSPDPQVQYPDQTQSFNRYTYVNNNPLSFTDPSGYGFFSKLWKKIRNIFRDPWTLVAIAAGFLTGYATWAALGYGGGFIWGGTAMAAGISAAVGSFVTTLILTEGDIRASLKAGLISGVTAFSGVQIRQGIKDYSSGRAWLYNVEVVGDEVIIRPANAGSVLDRLFVNGMLNKLRRAAELGLKQFDGQSFTLYYNPSHGFLADLTESALGKVHGDSSLSRGLAEILRNNPNLEVIAHSQGGIIASNALEHLSGVNLPGLRLTLNGSAVAERVARAGLKAVGGRLAAYNAHPLDLVPNVIALNTLNPIRVAGSIISSPFLLTRDSPHAAYY